MFAQSSLLLLSTALLRSVLVSADAASLCPARAEGACYAVTVPKTTAGGSSKDIYFQISAPSSLQWIGFGQSNDGQMAGANVFVLYQSADGKNVTLSKRHASGNYQPTVDSSIDATLLEGSGIIGGKMVANVRCSTCLSWDGGSISPTGTDTKWIWSVRKGTPIMSDDAGYNIVQHNFYGDFNFDLTKAVDATGSQNPLYAASQHTGSSNSTTAGSGAGASTGATEGTSSATPSKSYSIAHGVLMSAAFLIIMPAGALLKRLGFSKRSAMVSNPTSANNRFRSLPHAIVELFAVTEITVGLGLGLYVANKKDLLRDRAHTALGLVIFSFVILQALGGMATYWLFTSKPGKPRVIGRVHQWMGRSIFILGIINGVLGIQLVGDDPNSANIVYAVIAALAFVIYTSIIVKWYIQRHRMRKQLGKGEYEDSKGSEPEMSGGAVI